MKRLPVWEAAERLGISEEAVRQRMRRGTLAGGEWPDGRQYVYWDTNKDAPPNAEDSTSQKLAQNRQRSWWDYIAGVSGLAIVFGGITYVLGLFTLWVPIARYYTHDFTAAWHATSLASRVMVAGLGVRQLIAFPLLLMVLVLILSFVFDRALLSLMYARRKQSSARPNESGNGVEDAERLDYQRAFTALSAVWASVLLYVGWRILDGSSQADFLGALLLVFGALYLAVSLVQGGMLVFGMTMFPPLRTSQTPSEQSAEERSRSCARRVKHG